MRLSREEQETIITYNEAETLAAIYTHNRGLQKQLNRLCSERPADVKLIRTVHDGEAMEFEIPKKWIRIRPKRVASEAQKAAARLALQRARNAFDAPAPDKK